MRTRLLFRQGLDQGAFVTKPLLRGPTAARTVAGRAQSPLVWRGAVATVAGARPPCAPVLYVCIPVHNEAATVGVLLWRLRTVLQDAGRDYEVVVYDDASTDATAEVLAPYGRVLPLTVLGGSDASRRGRTGATEALVRHVVAHSRYPRRDACLLLQGDFTDRAEDVPALLAAFEQGTDVVVGRRDPDEAQPPAERRLRRMAPWVLRPLVRVEGVDDLLGGPRLVRVAALRDVVRARGAGPLLTSEGWAGAAELLAAVVPFARRVAVVDTPGRYDVRPRASRLDWAAELRVLARYAWRARGTHARPHATPAHADRLAEPSPARPAAVAVDGTAGAGDRNDESRPERPRRARPARARNEVSHREPPASKAAVESQASDATRDVDWSPPPAPRERLAPPPRDPTTALDGESQIASADERPPTTGRERHARRSVSTERVDAGIDTAALAPDTAPEILTRPTPAGPAGAAIVSSATGPADLPELAASDSADAQPGRRRKRRPRRRPRDAGLVEPADDAPAGDEPKDESPGQPNDPGTAGNDAAEDDRLADDSSPAGPAAGKRRRRRRARGRSDVRPSGVPPEVTVRDDDG